MTDQNDTSQADPEKSVSAGTEDEEVQERQLLPNFGGIRLLYVVYTAFGLLLALTAAFVIYKPIRVLPRVRLAPGFILTNQDRDDMNNEQFRGKLTLYNFTYTRCQPPECRQFDTMMKEVQEGLDGIETYDLPVELVTITIDPEYDTPEVLKAYSQEIGADTSNWHFLTSDDPRQIRRVVGTGFQVYYKENAPGEIEFIPTMILVDGWGIVRGIYNDRIYGADPDRILSHLNVVASEAAFSKGANRAGYEAAHLFLCFAD
jgi:protein SCO1/2